MHDTSDIYFFKQLNFTPHVGGKLVSNVIPFEGIFMGELLGLGISCSSCVEECNDLKDENKMN
jgi:hypothetical protein